MSLYDELSDLPLTVEGWSSERLEAETTSDFTRTTTVLTLRGGDETGRGEDVTYDAAAHDSAAFPTDLDLAGTYTFDEFAAALAERDLFPAGDPEQSAARRYRRWAFESAALDLALRQVGTNLGSALGRAYRPLNFVASTRLGDPPTADRVHAFREAVPELYFKLDPTSDWDDDLVAELADIDAVRVVDLKGQYEGTAVDQPADPDLYRRVVDGFSGVIVEDPRVTEATRPIVERVRSRLSWDYPVTGPDAVDAEGFQPAWVNVKPSRFGGVEALLDTVEHCERAGIHLYGGGQFELGVGRDHLHTFASLLYPDGPNDVAPRAYNHPGDPREADLPAPPLAPPADPRGLGFR